MSFQDSTLETGISSPQAFEELNGLIQHFPPIVKIRSQIGKFPFIPAGGHGKKYLDHLRESNQSRPACFAATTGFRIAIIREEMPNLTFFVRGAR